jgi:molybdopterin converting factor small subunit
MAKVKLIIRPWLSSMMDSDSSGPISLEEETDGHPTVGGVLLSVAARNKIFGETVFDESRDDLSGRISVSLNNRLLGQHKDLDIIVKDGDVLMLFPAFEGG